MNVYLLKNGDLLLRKHYKSNLKKTHCLKGIYYWFYLFAVSFLGYIKFTLEEKQRPGQIQLIQLKTIIEN